MAKKLVYHNRFGYYLILGEAHNVPDPIAVFDRGAETVVFELVRETDRAYWYREMVDVPIVGDEPSELVTDEEETSSP